MQVLTLDTPPESTWKLFYGDTGNFLRIDQVDYPVFKRLYEIGYGSFWTWKKFDFTRDRQGWEQIDEVGRRMFLLNNGYQAAMDSGVVGIYSFISTITTNTELALLYSYINQNESIHAASYSYGLTQMFGIDAKPMIDVVYTDPVIKQRLENEIDYSSAFVQSNIIEQRTDDNAKLDLVRTIVAAYMLEHIKFPFSFLVTWSVNKAYNKALETFSLLLTEIAHDELVVHTSTNAAVIKALRKEARQGFKHLFTAELDQFIIDYARKVAEQELEWNAYLFSEGPINGFTEEVGAAFIRHYTDRALKLIGFDPIYNEPKNDVIEWYDMYRNSNNKNTAAQETQNINYQKGSLVNDLSTSDFSSYHRLDCP
jgi:ribonucleoside-diphosphate reductase beta chain